MVICYGSLRIPMQVLYTLPEGLLGVLLRLTYLLLASLSSFTFPTSSFELHWICIIISILAFNRIEREVYTIRKIHIPLLDSPLSLLLFYFSSISFLCLPSMITSSQCLLINLLLNIWVKKESTQL